MSVNTSLDEKLAVVYRFLKKMFSESEQPGHRANIEKMDEDCLGRTYDSCQAYFTAREEFEKIRDEIFSGPPITEEEIKRFLNQ